MATKTELKKLLDKLIGDADEQTQLHESSTQMLYRTLGEVYLWWRDARKVDGFLDELYAERELVQRGKEENFTRLVRLVWQLGWDGHESPRLQNWAKSLRGVHHEYETNTDAYRVQDPAEKIRQFFQHKGGIGAVGRSVSPLQQTDEEVGTVKQKISDTKKTAKDVLSDQKIRAKHFELGEQFFSTKIPEIKNIARKSVKLDLTRKGYAVALVRKSSTGSYDILSISNSDSLVQDAIVETYKRNDDGLSQVLRVLTEVIETQTLPVKLEKHRRHLTDISSVIASDGKTQLAKIKRILLRPKTRDILLSECRSDCSVVTIAKPKKFPSNITEPITLRSVNQKYLEQNLIQSRDICFYTTLTSKIQEVEDPSLKASHVIRIKNTVTSKIHNMYFYRLSYHAEGSRRQADINFDELISPNWKATVDKHWINELQSRLVATWMSEFGHQINRDRHKQVILHLSEDFEVGYDGTQGNYTKKESGMPRPQVSKDSKPVVFFLRSKDIFSVLNSLYYQNIVSDIALTANDHAFTVSYETPTATYSIALPTCDSRGHLNKTAFMAYEG